MITTTMYKNIYEVKSKCEEMIEGIKDLDFTVEDYNQEQDLVEHLEYVLAGLTRDVQILRALADSHKPQTGKEVK